MSGNEKFILDVTAGMRKIWFDKNQENTVFLDKKDDSELLMDYRNTMRAINRYGIGNYKKRVRTNPTVVGDYAKIEYPNNTFDLIVFDPPHFIKKKQDVHWKFKTWGCLNAETWQSEIKKATRELLRVLKPHGILIFKWNDTDVSVKEVLTLFPIKPLFGHLGTRRKKKNRTYWLCFMKIPEAKTA